MAEVSMAVDIAAADTMEAIEAAITAVIAAATEAIVAGTVERMGGTAMVDMVAMADMATVGTATADMAMAGTAMATRTTPTIRITVTPIHTTTPITATLIRTRRATTARTMMRPPAAIITRTARTRTRRTRIPALLTLRLRAMQTPM